MFSITTVPLSTRMPTASAKPPSVMVFSVSPAAPMNSTAVMTDSGIEARMMSVRRQLPRNSRIMSAVRPAAIRPAEQHAVERGLDEHRLVEERLDAHPGGQHVADLRQRRADAVDDRERRDAAGACGCS